MLIPDQSYSLRLNATREQLPQHLQMNHNRLISADENLNDPMRIPPLSSIFSFSDTSHSQYHYSSTAGLPNHLTTSVPTSSFFHSPHSTGNRDLIPQPNHSQIVIPNPPISNLIAHNASIVNGNLMNHASSHKLSPVQSLKSNSPAHSNISDEDSADSTTNVKSSSNSFSRQYKLWSDSEMNLLVSLVKGLNKPPWKKLASHFEGRNASQIKMQYRRLMKKQSMKREKNINNGS